MQDITPEVLTEQFVKIAHGIRDMRWRLGEIYNQLVQLESKAATVRRLRAALPNAKDLLGYSITQANLDAMGTMASTFHEDGAVVSPDGLHSVTREDMEAFGLTPTQTAQIATALREGKLRVKQVAKLARKASRSEAGSEKHIETVGKMLGMLDEAVNGKPERTVAVIAAEIAKVDQTLERAQSKREQLVKELREARDGDVAADAEPTATKVDAPSITKGKPRARRTTQPNA